MATKTVEKKSLTTTRQRELLRVIDECFDNFAKRNQSYYSLDGMSTAHVALHAIADFQTLQAFWPERLVDRHLGTVIYRLEDNTMSQVQSSVRDVLAQLQDKGYVEQLGNEHERRWRPIRERQPKKTKVYDDNHNHVGWTHMVDGKLQFTPVSE